MTPPHLSWEELVAYWAGDLAPADVDRMDEHLMSCGACTAESSRVAAVARALRAFVPQVVTRAAVDALRARGVPIEENTFAPSRKQPVVFRRGLELLIHRLAGFDLSNVDRVRVTIRVESTGEIIFEDPSAPFDREDGVLIACQRHYAGLPPDTVFEVRATEASGGERTAVYTIPHEFEV